MIDVARIRCLVILLAVASACAGCGKGSTSRAPEPSSPQTKQQPPQVATVVPRTKTAIAKKYAEQWIDATLRDDYAKVIDYTYPEAVNAFGGRDRAIELSASAAAMLKDQLKAKGMARSGMSLGEPGEFHTRAGAAYVIIPMVVELSFTGGKARGKSFILGISKDGGDTWKFIDGGGLSDHGFRQRVVPNLPDRLVMPEAQPFEFTKDH